MAAITASTSVAVSSSSKIASIGSLAETSSNKVSSVRFGGVFSAPALKSAHFGQSLSSNSGKSRRVTTAVQASEVEADYDYADTPLSPPEASPKLYVGNLPFNVDSAGLAKYFSEAGVVDQVDVIYDRESGRSRGFAFVTMATIQDAEAAIQSLDGTELSGRSLRVGFPQARNDRAPRSDRGDRAPRNFAPSGTPGSGNKLYVGNLSWGMDDYGLADLFSEFGQVVEAKVVMDRETGKSRGFGFVTFGSSPEGTQAVNALDGAEVDGRTIRVSVAQDRAPSRGRF